MFCRHCGAEISNIAVICVKCGVATGIQPVQPIPVPGRSPHTRVAYVLLGIFLGAFGVHNFYAGFAGRGVAQLLITLFLGWLIIPLLAVGIWVLIEICTTTHDAYGNMFS